MKGFSNKTKNKEEKIIEEIEETGVNITTIDKIEEFFI